MNITRGTTPTIICKVCTDIPFDQIQNILVSIEQFRLPLLTASMDEGRVMIEEVEKEIHLRLTQEETLALNTSGQAYVGIRILLSDGTAYALRKPEPIFVGDIIRGGVIK